MKQIKGGVCAPQGFTAAAAHCGIRKNRDDLALIYCKTPCEAAAVYTKNLVQAAPIKVTKKNLLDGKCRAVICNSGNANACTKGGEEAAQKTCEAVARELGLSASDVAVASTGVIGVELDPKIIISALPEMVKSLSKEGAEAAANAIMTTDTVNKQIAVEAEIGGKAVRMGAMCKGSGMIHPNMGTMLAFITTDAAISQKALDTALHEAADMTFNCISVDGDTSTNDMALVMANGAAGNAVIEGGGDYEAFKAALIYVCTYLAKAIAGDGEGATKLIECNVSGAESLLSARVLAKGVIGSSLTKAAVFGKDANWGRILCALGYSGAAFDPEGVDISISSKAGRIDVCAGGKGTLFDEELGVAILSENPVVIEVKLKGGNFSATAWGCDLTYDYVRINGSYRS